METKTLNMEQRKILKELFLERIRLKRCILSEQESKARKDLIGQIDKEFRASSEYKLMEKLRKQERETFAKLRRKFTYCQYGPATAPYITGNYGSDKDKRLANQDKQYADKLRQVKELELEITADIYSPNVEYTEMVKLLETKIAKIMK